MGLWSKGIYDRRYKPFQVKGAGLATAIAGQLIKAEENELLWNVIRLSWILVPFFVQSPRSLMTSFVLFLQPEAGLRRSGILVWSLLFPLFVSSQTMQEKKTQTAQGLFSLAASTNLNEQLLVVIRCWYK